MVVRLAALFVAAILASALSCAAQVSIGGPTGSASADTAALQSGLMAAAGRELLVPPGKYAVNATLYVQSSTRLVCSPGTVLAATGWLAPYVPGQPFSKGGYVLLENQNADASTITDHDITVEGCQFDGGGLGGGFHVIEMRMASRITIRRVRCFDGAGDCTAMLATSGTLVEDSWAERIRNACWDHWEGATNGVVAASNHCESMVYGTLVTGVGTGGEVRMADNFWIGGSYVMTPIDGHGPLAGTPPQAAIWVMGAGGGSGSGSGASHVTVAPTYISCTPSCVQPVRVSGAGTGNKVMPLVGVGLGATPLVINADSGGTPTNTTVVSGTVQ